MPLYDIKCSNCEGIRENARRREFARNASCPYCGKATTAMPAMSGSRVTMRLVEAWKPRSRAQQLAEAVQPAPATHAGAGRSSVLHNCKGFNCSICGT